MKSLLTASLLLVSLTSIYADDIMALSDEFDDATTLTRWSRLNDTEGWNADQLEQWDIDTTVAGQMRMMPYTSAWFDNLKGVLAYKEVTGDFIVTAHLEVGARSDFTQPPNRSFSLGGIFVHRPTIGRTAAGPIPFPVGTPTWPPPVAPAMDAYTTDWMPNEENYIFLSFGSAGNPGTRQYEVKTTTNSDSSLYFANRGVPNSGVITLQFVMVGNTAVTLRRHPGGDWVVENRYTVGAGNSLQSLPDYDHDGDPATDPVYQVGITTYTDWPNIQGPFYSGNSSDAHYAGQFQHNYSVINTANGFSNQPDFIANVEYVRFERPHPNLTEGMLATLDVDFDRRFDTVAVTPLALLPGTGAGQYLGDNAVTAAAEDYATYQQSQFGAQAGDPEAAFDADFDEDDFGNGLEYALGTDPNDATAAPPFSSQVVADYLTIAFTPEPTAASRLSLIVEYSTTLLAGQWFPLATRQAGSAGWTIDEVGAQVSVNANTDAVTVTDAVSTTAENRRFLRVRAVIP